jgi:GNAT superfamily N-acetyltransferase
VSTTTALRKGLHFADASGQSVLYRHLSDADDLDGLTTLLHVAYAPLAEAGMHFVASHQTVETTRKRLARGLPIVAVIDGAVIGTITVATIQNTGGSPFYDRPDVASVGQFAVAPELQNRGIGSVLMRVAEQCAVECGAAYLALDTSEHAAHLIGFYENRGFRFIEYIRYPDVNYRSVVMAKPVTASPDWQS